SIPWNPAVWERLAGEGIKGSVIGIARAEVPNAFGRRQDQSCERIINSGAVPLEVDEEMSSILAGIEPRQDDRPSKLPANRIEPVPSLAEELGWVEKVARIQ